MSYRIAKKGGQLIAATFADFETADNFIKHRPDSLPDATILLDCDDSYQWVGIQQLMKLPNGGPGVNAIAAERLRQLESEGWWPDHDDKWDRGELVQAAILYAFVDQENLKQCMDSPSRYDWPWEESWFKPLKKDGSGEVDRIRCLEKAGALIAAEIDRLKRKEARPKAGCDHCTDPDGVCCYPTYGMAPHTHDMNKTGSAIGSTVFLPRSEWPDNFDPDPDAEGCGTWTHCPKCGAPGHQDLFEKKGE